MLFWRKSKEEPIIGTDKKKKIHESNCIFTKPMSSDIATIQVFFNDSSSYICIASDTIENRRMEERGLCPKGFLLDKESAILLKDQLDDWICGMARR